MYRHDIIPVKDIEFNIFQSNLIARVQPNITAWNIPTTAFNRLLNIQTRWNAIWGIAKNVTTRSRADVQDKRDARKDYEAELRVFIKAYLNYNPEINDTQRVEMSLRVRDRKPTPAPIPESIPFVEINTFSSARIRIRYKKESGKEGVSGRRSKPEHVSYMEFAYKIGEPAPMSINDCNGRVNISRIPFPLDFKHTDSGKRLYWFARWVNTRQQPGPCTSMGSIIIPY